VYQKPQANFSTDPNTTSELSPGINFYNQSMGATSYNWDFGDPASGNNTSTSFDTEHVYSGPAEYTITLVATSDKGCKDTTQRVIQVTPEFAIYIPNTFTPDGNGKNDIFLPKGIGIDEDHFKMYIYDRWGEVIFTTNNFEQGWDGTVKGNNITAEQGVYIYKIYVRDKMGTDHEFTGHVNCLPKINKY
jgi:gliding motility-associated-like protein